MAAEASGDRIDHVLGSHEEVTRALARGVRAALQRHRQVNLPVAVWRDGKVAWAMPEAEAHTWGGAGLVRDNEREEDR